MPRGDFKEFDRMLLREIMLGANTITKLMIKETEFRTLAVSFLQDNAWRKLTSIALILGKRLQSLRHHGVIDWNGFSWQVANDCGECQTCKSAGIFAVGGPGDHKMLLWKGGMHTCDKEELLCVPCHDAKAALEASRRAEHTAIKVSPKPRSKSRESGERDQSAPVNPRSTGDYESSGVVKPEYARLDNIDISRTQGVTMLIVEFKEFDQMLLSEIMLGGNTLQKLMLKESEFRKLARCSRHDNAWRGLASISLILSRRLQALRLQGTIDWDGFAWQIVSDSEQCLHPGMVLGPENGRTPPH